MKDIFLCHTGADKAWVERLAERLEAETIRGRPIEVFFDKWDIDYGENILSRLEAALGTARLVGVVMSPAFTRADWPRLEWQSRVWQDPTGKAASILPILLHDTDPDTGETIDIPLPFRMLRWLDFTNPKQFEAAFDELLRRLRGEPPRRGGGNLRPDRTSPHLFVPPDAPDRADESLISNLLQVHRHPMRIWSDLTRAQKPGDVHKTRAGKFSPPFVLDSDRLYSFYAPDDPTNPFRSLLTGQDPKVERPLDWLTDPVRSRWLMWLYNDALRQHAFRLQIFTPRKGGQRQTSKERKQYYCPTFNGKPRTFRWSSRARAKTLAKVATRTDGSQFGVHQAARMRFINLGDAYLLIEPGWFFTTDGLTPLEGRQVGILSTRFGGRERNQAVLRNLLMWGLLLSQGQQTIDIALGAETLVLDAVPAHARVIIGVDGDTMKLERVLGGDGAGEVRSEQPASPYADGQDERDSDESDELDRIIALEASGALDIVLAATADRSEDMPGDAGDGADLDDAPVDDESSLGGAGSTSTPTGSAQSLLRAQPGPTRGTSSPAAQSPGDADEQKRRGVAANLELPF